MSKTRAAFAAAAISMVAPIAQGADSKKSPDAVLSGAYVLDPVCTQVGFSVGHIGFSAYAGRFSNASGRLDLKPAPKAKSAAAPSATVHISIPVASVATDSEMLDDQLRSADWLDATAFPTMTFASTTVTMAGGTETKVAGELTLHGITRPVIFDVRFVGAGFNPGDRKATAGFEISGDVKRSAFGVDKFMALVSDDVHLSINAAFEKQ